MTKGVKFKKKNILTVGILSFLIIIIVLIFNSKNNYLENLNKETYDFFQNNEWETKSFSNEEIKNLKQNRTTKFEGAYDGLSEGINIVQLVSVNEFGDGYLIFLNEETKEIVKTVKIFNFKK